MEICIIDDIDLDRGTIYDITKEAFRQYYDGNVIIVFDDGYNHKDYCRFNLHINTCPMWNSYTIRLYDRLLNKSESHTTLNANKYELFNGIARIAYDINKMNYASVDIASMYPKTEVKPMSIDEIRYMMKGENKMLPKIKKVHFNNPVTVVIWEDGTKTIVRAQDDESYDREKGLAMCMAKKALGNTGKYYDIFKEHLKDEEPKKEPVKATTRPKVFTETAERYSEEVKKQKKIGDGYDDIKWEENKRGRN